MQAVQSHENLGEKKEHFLSTSTWPGLPEVYRSVRLIYILKTGPKEKLLDQIRVCLRLGSITPSDGFIF